MRLIFAVTADYANISADGKLNIMGIFTQIYSTSFPAVHPSMYLVAILEAELGEFNQKRQMKVCLVDPDGLELMKMSNPITLPPIQKGQRPQLNFVSAIQNAVFPNPGPYQFVFVVDNDYKGETTINLEKIELPPALPQK